MISTDRGRPLTDIVSRLDDKGDLKRDIRTVFEQGSTIERRVQRADGTATYLMRVLPYRATITFRTQSATFSDSGTECARGATRRFGADHVFRMNGSSLPKSCRVNSSS